MPWIESHQSLASHVKLVRLCKVLSISKPQAVGHLHFLWWWALDGASDGDLSDLTPDEIEGFALWEGQAGAFHSAMVECGWIDENGKIHDWKDYGGRYHVIKEGNRRRQAALRKRLAKSNALVTRDVTVTNALVTRESRECNAQQDRTGQDQTGQESTEQNPNKTHGLSHGVSDKSREDECSEHCSSIAPSNAPSMRRRYPADVEEAKRMQPVTSVIPPDFVCRCFDKAESRGGKDAKGIPIADFNAYVRIEWNYDQERVRSGNGKSNIPDKIQRGSQVTILKARIEKRRGELQYQWQRDKFPELVKELADLEAQLEKLENEILHAT